MQRLAELVTAVGNQKGSWKNLQLAQDVKDFLWATYDGGDDLIYPTFEGWDELLAEIIDSNDYAKLSKDEVLSILFGLIHRNRIVEGLWWAMFERGVTQRLLKCLSALDADYSAKFRL